MKRAPIGILGIILTLIAGPASAGSLGQTLGADRQIVSVSPEKLILKDPMIGGLLSASLPGLGQIYAGQRTKGLLFLVSTMGAFTSAYAFVEPADLDLADYDLIRYGGNGDGVMGLTELQNWENDKYLDDAFDGLSSGRKVGAITLAAAGIGLYIWNIFDARSSSRKHNREVVQQRIDLGMTACDSHTGLALNVRF